MNKSLNLVQDYQRENVFPFSFNEKHLAKKRTLKLMNRIFWIIEQIGQVSRTTKHHLNKMYLMLSSFQWFLYMALSMNKDKYCLTENIQPRWDCDVDNVASINLGSKLGFIEPQKYAVYIMK